MNIAVISLTENGRLLSEHIASNVGAEHSATRYCYSEHSDGNCITFISLRGLIGKLFMRYDALVFVCAVGIAVRVCAPCIISKMSDPAVLAVDDGGNFAVSVLSGHLGGANTLTRQIADIVGAVPVITTATDARGMFSPDIFAKANRLVICDMTAAKKVAAAMLNGDTVGVRCSYPHSPLPDGMTEADSGSIGICISADPDETPFDVTLKLLPKNIIVGVGCKRGTPCERIEAHIERVFAENGLDTRRISGLATIDIKAGEAGLKRFCKKYSLPLFTFTADELMGVQGEFSSSDFVKDTTGADNVCERAAVCAGGQLTVPKTAENGITAAVSETPVYIDLERTDA